MKKKVKDLALQVHMPPNSMLESLFANKFLIKIPGFLSIFTDFNAASAWNKLSGGRIQARYISPFAIILHKEGVYPKIGKGTWIGHFCLIDGSQGLEIGEGCEITSGVHIYTHSTALRCTKDQEKQVGPVKIGNHVFIGPNSIISYDCEIADGKLILPLTYLPPHTRLQRRKKQ